MTAGAAAWLSGSATGELLGRYRLARRAAELQTIESLSQEVTGTLRRLGVCPDFPFHADIPKLDPDSSIPRLRDQLARSGTCVELAIAQQDFETFHIEAATLRLIECKKALATGLLTDSLSYESRKRALRLPRQR